jgi:DHA1 family tetracycline resistance protein-like MFS transporter
MGAPCIHVRRTPRFSVRNGSGQGGEIGIRNHPMFQALRELRGNPRYSVLTEWMFGIPYNMFNPFMSVYMLALGVTDQGIGLIASLSLAVQILSQLVSGTLVDKYGRRLTLFIADLVSFSIPCLIWAFSQNMTWFVVAALINGTWRVAHTAWTCLVIEDAEEHLLVHMWSWITIFGVGSSFFTPVGGWFVQRFGLVPAMRGLLLFGFVMLTAKCAVLYVLSHETERGVQRRMETRDQSLLSLLSGYRQVVGPLLRSRRIRGALALMTVTNIYNTVNGSFFGVLVTGKLGFPEASIALFAALGSITTAVGIFGIGPRFRNLSHARPPLWLGFGLYLLSQMLLVAMPPRSLWMLIPAVMLAGIGGALVNPIIEALLAVAMNTHERARISSIVYMLLLVITTPFGWIAGQLSAVDRALPFGLNLGLFALGMLLVWAIGREQRPLEGTA